MAEEHEKCPDCGTPLLDLERRLEVTDADASHRHHAVDCTRVLKAQVATLREALQFYADDGTHAPPGHSAEGWCRDSGHRARLALGLPSKDE